MNEKSAGLVLLGIILVSIGLLDSFGYLKIQLVDATSPEIIYTYPKQNGVYRPYEINEYVLYARDTESIVTSASLSTEKGIITLNPIGYDKIKHPLVPYVQGKQVKYPDLNFDGYVNQTDVDLLNTRNVAYDLNYDGIIDAADVSIMAFYFGTVSFAMETISSYSEGNYSMVFVTSNNYGLTTTLNIMFTIKNYDMLEGVWYIDGSPINGTNYVVNAKTIEVSFMTNVTDLNITVRALSREAIYYFDKTGAGTWKKQIPLYEKSTLTLEAYTETAMNTLTVYVEPTFGFSMSTIDTILVGLGALLILFGIVKREKEQIHY